MLRLKRLLGLWEFNGLLNLWRLFRNRLLITFLHSFAGLSWWIFLPGLLTRNNDEIRCLVSGVRHIHSILFSETFNLLKQVVCECVSLKMSLMAGTIDMLHQKNVYLEVVLVALLANTTIHILGVRFGNQLNQSMCTMRLFSCWRLAYLGSGCNPGSMSSNFFCIRWCIPGQRPERM